MYTSFRDGKHSANGFLDDYAFYVAALIELYNSTLEKEYLEKAQKLCNETVKSFADFENGGFYLCKSEDNELFVNPKETYDGAIPSGNSVMAYNFIRLYQLTEKEEFNDLAKKQIEFMSPKAEGYPAGNSLFLLALLIYENPPAHIVITLKESADREKVIVNLPLFSNVILTDESSEYPLINDKTTYYVCRDHMCQPPTNSLFDALNDKSFTLP